MAAGLRQIDISTAAGVTHTAVSRFETGAGSPRDLDELVGAYSRDCGVPARQLWDQALDEWERGRG